jgi:hypothetical protein
MWLVVLLVTIPTFAVTIAAFFGDLDWRLDLTSHFRPLYLLAEVVLLVFFTLLRRKWLSLDTLTRAPKIIPRPVRDFRIT